jgi:hypothetical protein
MRELVLFAALVALVAAFTLHACGTHPAQPAVLAKVSELRTRHGKLAQSETLCWHQLALVSWHILS